MGRDFNLHKRREYMYTRIIRRIYEIALSLHYDYFPSPTYLHSMINNEEGPYLYFNFENASDNFYGQSRDSFGSRIKYSRR